jgi:MFS transporter, putative metabolite:H+ symporter
LTDAFAGSPARTIDIAARLDRLPVTALHRWILVVSALGLWFDIAEIALSNALSAVFSAPPHRVEALPLSLLLASVYAGGAIGAPLLGRLGDRQGRRRAQSLALGLLALASIAAAFSPDLAWLTLFRFLSGMALGAFPPLAIAYLSDLLPPARRGGLIVITGALSALGAPAMLFLMRWLTPLQPLGFDGWRWLLVAGGISAGIIALLFRLLPESPRWLAAVGRGDEADAVCRQFERRADTLPAPTVPALALRPEPPLSPSAFRRRMTLLTGLYFLGPWAIAAFPMLSGAVMVAKGIHVSDSLLYAGIGSFGPSLGAIAAALFIDRIGRRTALVLCGGGLVLAGFGFAAGTSPLDMVLTGLAFHLIGWLHISVLNLYTAELFPTGQRAGTSAAAFAVNRVASMLVPIVLLPVLRSEGVPAMFAIMTASLVAGMALTLVFGPRGLAGRSLA